METGTVFVLLFVMATAVAIAVQRLAVPYTVALVFTGLVSGLLHAFEAPHLTEALIFNIFLPGPLFGVAFYVEFQQFWRNRRTVKSRISDRQAERLYQFITATDDSGKSRY